MGTPVAPAERRLHIRAGTVVWSLALLLALAGVLGQAFSRGFGNDGNVPTFVIITLNGLSLAGLYYITASGFTLIFGLMRITNLAHGGLFLLGGYVALDIAGQGVPWVVAALGAMVAAGIAGLVMHQLFLRWNQGQDLRQALLTIALSMILADLMLAQFGATPRDFAPPAWLADSLSLPLYGLSYPAFRIAIIAAAVLLSVLFWWVMGHTRIGILVRAGVDDGDMTSAIGVNIQRLFAGVFFVGSALAGLGGLFAGTVLSLAPGQDQAFLVSSLVVVIVGGMGSLRGAAVGALLLGLVDQYASAYLPSFLSNLSALLVFVLLAVVLAVRPTGLWGSAS